MVNFPHTIRPFAQWYDALYNDKNYEHDIKLFKIFTEQHYFSSILEIGAGTGNHSLLLAECCNHLTSCETDLDFHFLLKKKTTHIHNITTTKEPIEHIPVNEHETACAFFYVLNYLTTEVALQNFFRSIFRRLTKKGVFVADFWNGNFFSLNPPHNYTQNKSSTDWRAIIETSTSISKHDKQAKMTQAFNITRASGESVFFKEDYNLSIWHQSDIIEAANQAGFQHIKFHEKMPYKAINTSPFLWLTARK